jgi:hypothetical protein
MKIIAIQTDEKVLASVTIEELKAITGQSDLQKAFGISLNYGSGIKENFGHQKNMIEVPDYPVSKIFQDARETLASYEDLRSKFESIRNQLNTLMQKMVAAKEAKKQ